MPKMKSHKAATKRFKRTGTGKIMRGRVGVTHYLEGKTSRRKRRLQRSVTVSKADAPRVRRMIDS